MENVSERNERLWLLVASPTLWAAHFMASYLTAAIWCAKFAGPDSLLGPVRPAIGVYTVAALIGITIVGGAGLRRHRLGGASLPHDDDTPEDRHRFIGFATLLLSGMSAVATVYSALVVVFIENCQ